MLSMQEILSMKSILSMEEVHSVKLIPTVGNYVFTYCCSF